MVCTCTPKSCLNIYETSCQEHIHTNSRLPTFPGVWEMGKLAKLENLSIAQDNNLTLTLLCHFGCKDERFHESPF